MYAHEIPDLIEQKIQLDTWNDDYIYFDKKYGIWRKVNDEFFSFEGLIAFNSRWQIYVPPKKKVKMWKWEVRYGKENWQDTGRYYRNIEEVRKNISSEYKIGNRIDRTGV